MPSTFLRRSTLAVVVGALASFLLLPSAGAQVLGGGLLKPLPGAPAPAPSSAPPAGGTVIEGEALPGATVVTLAGTSGDRYGSVVRSSAAPPVAPGHYLLTARVRTAATARVDLLTGDRAAGSYGIGSGWTNVSAVVWLGAADPRVGVGSWVRSGTAPRIDVDWVHVASAPAGFTVRGTEVVRPDGVAGRIVGFNKGDYQDSYVRDGRLQISGNEWLALYRWGASTVRVGLNQEFWLANCAVWAGTTATRYQDAIRAEINALTNVGVNVMVSLVSTERGANTGCNVTEGILREMADSRSVTFWSSIANEFRSNPRVMFDLFNEPHSITPQVWRNGGTVTYGPAWFRRSFTAVGMQQLYNTVRGTGATNLVVVSGHQWAADPRVHLSHPLDGYGIVAASHSYCHQCPQGQPAFDPYLDINNDAEILARMPLTMTETGWVHTDDPRFLTMMRNWAEARGMGFMAYAWLAHGAQGAPDRYSIVGGQGSIIDVGGGAYTRRASASGAAIWNALAPVRVERGFQALPMTE